MTLHLLQELLRTFVLGFEQNKMIDKGPYFHGEMPDPLVGPVGHHEAKRHCLQNDHAHFDFIKRYICTLHGWRATLFSLRIGHKPDIQVYLEQMLAEGLDIPAPSGAGNLQKQVVPVAFTCTWLHDL